jgi:hypothetical protein
LLETSSRRLLADVVGMGSMGQGCGVEVGYAHVCLGALDSGALGREPSAVAESDMMNSDRNVVFERGVRLYTRLAIKLETQRQERRVVDLKIRQQLASLYTPSYLCFTPVPPAQRRRQSLQHGRGVAKGAPRIRPLACERMRGTRTATLARGQREVS